MGEMEETSKAGQKESNRKQPEIYLKSLEVFIGRKRLFAEITGPFCSRVDFRKCGFAQRRSHPPLFAFSDSRILHLRQWFCRKERQSSKLVRLGVQKKFNPSARLASLDGLLETVLPTYLNPTPSRETLRDWFDTARIPHFKANPAAKRGGGTVFYSVAAVEKFLQTRTLFCRLPAATLPDRGGSKIQNN